MDDLDWSLFLVAHDLLPEARYLRRAPSGLPIREPRRAGDPAFRAAAVCLHKACGWVGTASQAHVHRDITGHPTAWPGPEPPAAPAT